MTSPSDMQEPESLDSGRVLEGKAKGSAAKEANYPKIVRSKRRTWAQGVNEKEEEDLRVGGFLGILTFLSRLFLRS